MNKAESHIAIIGSGRLAAFFGESLQRAGIPVSFIISRNTFTGKVLADVLGAEFSEDLTTACRADLIFLAVHDDSVARVSQSLPPGPYTICHSAGALALDVLAGHAKRAVVWPLQSIGGNLDTSAVPVLLESSDAGSENTLKQLFERAGFQVHLADTALRMRYHLAAVFANNFSNAMLAASELVSESENLNPELLKPLVERTFENALNRGALKSQTGPAARGDFRTMERHLEQLSFSPKLQSLYREVSAFITWIKGRQS